eukprot:2927430-Lingulodinium_polyedra.AAC.1
MSQRSGTITSLQRAWRSAGSCALRRRARRSCRSSRSRCSMRRPFSGFLSCPSSEGGEDPMEC